MSQDIDNTKKHGGGPKTPEGKRRSSLNATRHGLLSQTVVLATENTEAFQELLDDYVRDFAPRTRFELDLVQELVACRWRIQRIWSLEQTIFEIGMKRSVEALKTEFNGDTAENLLTAFAFMDMSGGDRYLQLLHRYEARMTRRMHQIQAELRSIAKERTQPVQKTVQKIVPNELPKPVLLPRRDDKQPPKTDKLPPEEDDAA